MFSDSVFYADYGKNIENLKNLFLSQLFGKTRTVENCFSKIT